MLIKQFFNGGGNYEKSLRQRRWASVGMLAVGLVGFACYFWLVPDSGLPEYARGFYLGAASGISGAALVLLIRTQYLITHPQAQRKARIKETDEREMHIARTAAQAAGFITFYCAVVGTFIFLPLSMTAYYTLAGVIGIYSLSYVLLDLWLSKKL